MPAFSPDLFCLSSTENELYSMMFLIYGIEKYHIVPNLLNAMLDRWHTGTKLVNAVNNQ